MKNKKFCINCNNLLIKRQQNIFCSAQCQQDFELEKRIKMGLASHKTLRRYLIKKHGKKCWQCNLEKWLDKDIPLVLDHIDGNSDNNLLPNLRMLCCNCDALTPTYKSKNRGNGRYYRRLRYKQGKSI